MGGLGCLYQGEELFLPILVDYAHPRDASFAIAAFPLVGTVDVRLGCSTSALSSQAHWSLIGGSQVFAALARFHYPRRWIGTTYGKGTGEGLARLESAMAGS